MAAPPPTRWLTTDLVLLDGRCPLPLDEPFTSADAGRLGVSRWYLRALVRRELVREVARGVYVAAQVTDTLELRAAALRLVVPDSAVVTDRTAAWLHGVDILPRSAVHQAPPVQIFDRAGSRVRRAGVSSGRRTTILASDLTTVGGVRVTTPLRTALDLGRLLGRYDAIGALDAFLAAGVSHGELLAHVERFRGERGVIQLRTLAPLADARAESPPESALRLHWLDAGLAAPEPQWWVCDEAGVPVFRLDLGLPACRFGAEFNGHAFHDSEEAKARDGAREEWLSRREGWTIATFWSEDLYARGADPQGRLVAGVAEARSRLGEWRAQGRFIA